MFKFKFQKAMTAVWVVLSVLGLSILGTASTAAAQDAGDVCATQTLSTNQPGSDFGFFVSYHSFALGELVPVDGCALTGTATITESNNCDANSSEEQVDIAIKQGNQIRFGDTFRAIEDGCGTSSFSVDIVGHTAVEVLVNVSFSENLTVRMNWGHLPVVEEPAEVAEAVNITAHNLIGCDGSIVSSSVRLQEALSGDVGITLIGEDNVSTTTIPAGQTEAAIEGVDSETFVNWTFGDQSGSIFNFVNTLAECNPATDTPIPEETVEETPTEEVVVEEETNEEVVVVDETPEETPEAVVETVEETVTEEVTAEEVDVETDDSDDTAAAAEEGPQGPELAMTGPGMTAYLLVIFALFTMTGYAFIMVERDLAKA